MASNTHAASPDEVIKWIMEKVYRDFFPAKGRTITKMADLRLRLEELAVSRKPRNWTAQSVKKGVKVMWEGDNEQRRLFIAQHGANLKDKPPIAVTQQQVKSVPGPSKTAAKSSNTVGQSSTALVAKIAALTMKSGSGAAGKTDTAGPPKASTAATPAAAPSGGSVDKGKVKEVPGTPNLPPSLPKVSTTSKHQSTDSTDMWDFVPDIPLLSFDTPPTIPRAEEQLFFLPSRGQHKPEIKADDELSAAMVKLLLSEDALAEANADVGTIKVPQFGLLGEIADGGAAAMRVFANCNVPFSAFICGLQGSGKSHTLSCFLENMMIPEPRLGFLRRPLPGIVFHFNKYSQSTPRPCEAAFLGKKDDTGQGAFTFRTVRKVNVYVSSTNYANAKRAYNSIPNASISPLRIRKRYLTSGAIMQLMAVGAGSMPLYMHVLMQVLRDLATESVDGEVDYDLFKKRLLQTEFSREQKTFLNMRMGLLESFLEEKEGNQIGELFCTDPGVLTIIDLSSQFVDPETACAIFKVVLDIYISSATRAKTGGMAIALDEAHMYLSSPSPFSESILSLVRLQRHYGARVVISTQEPAVSPELLDLCSVTVCHRFSSPEWFKMVFQHVDVCDLETGAARRLITKLNVGEAVVFTRSADLRRGRRRDVKESHGASSTPSPTGDNGWGQAPIPEPSSDWATAVPSGQESDWATAVPSGQESGWATAVPSGQESGWATAAPSGQESDWTQEGPSGFESDWATTKHKPPSPPPTSTGWGENIPSETWKEVHDVSPKPASRDRFKDNIPWKNDADKGFFVLRIRSRLTFDGGRSVVSI